jgi:S1/P1 Nuclease
MLEWAILSQALSRLLTMSSHVAAAIALVLTFGSADASAWGCDGHRAVVFIAERLLSRATLASVTAALAAAPIDSGLRRFCDPVPDDPIADSSTWADDYRDVDPATFGWHFINLPRGATPTASNMRRYCPRGDCAVAAIPAQFRALSTSSSTQVRGNALRFLLHFIGDLHQPLHATTNGDRGGNCVPVTYYDRAPQENANGDFSPNLHGVWDTSTIRTLMAARGVADARALARYVVARRPLPSAVAPLRPSAAVVTRWAQRAHAIGRDVVYARLPAKLAAEPAAAARLSSCTDNDDVVHRMLAKHEVIDARYEQASVPAIVGQLRLAGMRLAAVLKAAYP